MKARTFLAVNAAALALSSAVLAKEGDWMTKKPSDWVAEDVTEVLGKSPWVSTIQAFPAALASMDAKAEKPTATANRVAVQARWFSAGVMRQAIARNAEIAGATLTAEERAERTRPDDRFYEVLLASAEKLDVLDTVPFEQIAKSTTLEAGGQSFPLVNLVRPADLKGPQAQFIFQKGKGIPTTAKSISLKTEWNGTKLEFKWDVTKMVWKAECEGGAKPTHDIVGDAKTEKPDVRDLDGDFCPIGTNEARRREIQAAILGSGDEAMNRAIADVRVTKPKAETPKWSVYVFYDASKELSSPAEATAVNAASRKAAMSKAVGKWSAANKSPLEALLFVNSKAGKVEDYMMVADAEKLAKMDGDAATKFFKEKLQKPDAKPTAGKDSPAKEAAAKDAPKKEAPKKK